MLTLKLNQYWIYIVTIVVLIVVAVLIILYVGINDNKKNQYQTNIYSLNISNQKDTFEEELLNLLLEDTYGGTFKDIIESSIHDELVKKLQYLDEVFTESELDISEKKFMIVFFLLGFEKIADVPEDLKNMLESCSDKDEIVFFLNFLSFSDKYKIIDCTKEIPYDYVTNLHVAKIQAPHIRDNSVVISVCRQTNKNDGKKSKRYMSFMVKVPIVSLSNILETP